MARRKYKMSMRKWPSSANVVFSIIRIARKKSRGVEDKLKRVIQEFHYKIAHYLLQRFKTIVVTSSGALRHILLNSVEHVVN
jgi:hypothetical protein